jgi:hypothetical protein
MKEIPQIYRLIMILWQDFNSILYRIVMSKYLLFILVCFGVLNCQTPRTDRDYTARTCAYLWSKQSADGGWHSEVHGLLKGGKAYTPFIVWHLLAVPDEIYPKSPEKIQKALHFIRKNIKNGVLGAEGIVLEYPNYATAYALRVLVKYGNAAADKPLIDRMKNYLASQQFNEKRGVQPENVAYGGWGFGETNLSKGEVGHTDLSNTRRVLQALRAAGHTHAETYQQAVQFLQICQKHPEDTRKQPIQPENDSVRNHYDGGFYYSPIVTPANKGLLKDGFFRSYATAACDGILALLAVGTKPTDEKLQAAKRWLETHPELNSPEGIPLDHPEGWNQVMILYHLAVRAEAYQALQIKGNWKAQMLNLLLTKQQPDGSFSNPEGARNKENDPLLGSTLALTALWICMKE